jgi:hypothetical protein
MIGGFSVDCRRGRAATTYYYSYILSMSMSRNVVTGVMKTSELLRVTVLVTPVSIVAMFASTGKKYTFNVFFFCSCEVALHSPTI